MSSNKLQIRHKTATANTVFQSKKLQMLEQLPIFREHGLSVPHLQRIISRLLQEQSGYFLETYMEAGTHLQNLSPSHTKK